ncbi:hypothetical protein ABPG74_010592 [Tetrahymena malaccensis]
MLVSEKVSLVTQQSNFLDFLSICQGQQNKIGQIDNNRYLNSNSGVNKQIKKTLNLNYLSQISPYITNPSSKNRSKSIKNNSQSINITETEKIAQNQSNVIRQSLIHEQFNNQVEKPDKYKFSMSDKKYPTSPGNQTLQNLNNSSASKAIQNSIFAIRSSQKGNQSNMQHRLMVKPSTASNFHQKNNKKANGNKALAILSISGVDQKNSGINSTGYNKYDSSVKMKTEYNIYSDKLAKKIFDENVQSMNQTAGSTKRKNSSQIVFNTQNSQKDFNVHQSFDNNSFSQMINSYANSVYIPNQSYPSNYIQQSPNTYQSNNFYMSTNSNNFSVAQQQNEISNTNNSNNIYASQMSGSQALQNFDNVNSMTHSTNLIEDMPLQDSQVINSFSKSTNLSQNKSYFPIHSKQASINIASNIQTLSQRSPQIVYPSNNGIQQNSHKNNTVYFQLENQNNYNSCLNSINHTHNHSILNGSSMQAVSQSHKSSSKNSQKQSFSIPSSTNQKLNSILKISIQNNQKQKISAMSPNTSNQNSYITNKTNYKKQYSKQKNLSFGSKILQNFLNTQSIDFNQSSQKKPISTPNRVNNSEMGYREKVNSILKGITNQIEQIQFQQHQATNHNSKAYSQSQRISHTMHTQMDTNPSPTSQDKNPIIKTLSQPQLPPQQQQCQISDFLQENTQQKEIKNQQTIIKDPFLKDLEYVSDYMHTLQHNEQFVANVKHPFYFCSSTKQQVSQNQKENVQVDKIKQTIQQSSQNKSSIQDWKQKMQQKLQSFNSSVDSGFQKQQTNLNGQIDQQQQKSTVQQSLDMQQEYQIYKQNYLNLDQLNSQQNNQIKPTNQLQNILSLNQNFNLNKTNYLKRNNV